MRYFVGLGQIRTKNVTTTLGQVRAKTNTLNIRVKSRDTLLQVGVHLRIPGLQKEK